MIYLNDTKMKAKGTRKGTRKRKKGKLTSVDFFMMSFGSMVGVGWTVSSNHWLAQAGGPWPAFIGFIIGTILLVPIGLSYGELMGALPVNGGVMTYSYRAFGSVVAFFSSWFVALAYLTILPWEAIYINRIVTNFIPWFRDGLVLYQVNGQDVYLRAGILGLFLAAFLLLMNYKGSKFAAKMQNIFTWIIISVGLLTIVLSFILSDGINLMPFYKNIDIGKHNSPYTGIMTMVVIVPFFMAGFDTVSQSIEEAKPSLTFKKIARSLVISILAAGIFYALIIISTAGVEPWADYAREDTPAIAMLMRRAFPGFMGKALHGIVLFGTLAGLLSTWNGMFMAAGRLLQSMGRAGLISLWFAKDHPRYKTPTNAFAFCFVAAAAGPFVGFGFIDPLTNLGSVAFVMGWFFTCLSAIKLRGDEPDLRRPFRIPGGRMMLFLALMISGAILILCFIPGQSAFMGKVGVILFLAWSALGAIFYFITNGGDRGMSDKERRRKIFPWR